MNLRDLAVVQGCDIDVGDAGVASGRFAFWPTHDFDTLVTNVRSGREDFF